MRMRDEATSLPACEEADERPSCSLVRPKMSAVWPPGGWMTLLKREMVEKKVGLDSAGRDCFLFQKIKKIVLLFFFSL